MTYRIARLALVAFSCFLFLVSGQARAELTLAVVDVDVILTQSKAAKSIQGQVDKKRNGFLDDVKKEEDKLRAEQKAIESQKDNLSKDELVKKAQEFEKRRLDARNTLQDKKSKLDSAYAESMNTLTKTIFDVCQQIANERGIDLVITRQNIIVGNMSLDITKDVLDAMNKKLPNLTLNVK